MTATITEALTAAEARRLTARIRDALALADVLVARAYAGRAWAGAGLPRPLPAGRRGPDRLHPARPPRAGRHLCERDRVSWQDEILDEIFLMSRIRQAFPEERDLVERLQRAASERGWRLARAWDLYLEDPTWQP
jgi:hypothetical protein